MSAQQTSLSPLADIQGGQNIYDDLENSNQITFNIPCLVSIEEVKLMLEGIQPSNINSSLIDIVSNHQVGMQKLDFSQKISRITILFASYSNFFPHMQNNLQARLDEMLEAIKGGDITAQNVDEKLKETLNEIHRVLTVHPSEVESDSSIVSTTLEIEELKLIEERWSTRDKSLKENPIDFVQRVYSDYIGKGLKRGHLRHVDPQLSKAIDNWSCKPGNKIPESILPSSYTKHDVIDVSPDDIRKYNKISALKMRKHRKSNS